MIERINGRIAAVLVVCVVLLVILLGWYAFVAPQRSKAASLDGQIGTLQGQIASTQAYLANPATRQYAKQLRRLKLAMPDDVQMSQILRELSSIAKRSGVRITAITPGALVPSAGGQAEPIALTVQGHYFRLASFLHLLRTRADVSQKTLKVTGRLYSVDSIQFNSGTPATGGTGTGSGGPTVISASVSLNAFIATAAPAPPSTAGTTTTQ